MAEQTDVKPRKDSLWRLVKDVFRGFGKDADGVKRHADRLYLLIVIVLLGFGLVMLFSASYAYSYYWRGDSFYFIGRQMAFAAAGLAAMFFFTKFDYRYFSRFAWLIYVVAIALLLVVFLMPPLNNARRWIILGGATFQPSEIAKLAIIVLFARLIDENRDEMGTFRKGVVPFILPLGLMAILIVLEPHMSGTIIIVVIAFLMMIVGGTKIWWFIGAGGLGGTALVAFVMLSDKMDYVAKRVEIWLNPWVDPGGDGFQIIQSLLAIGSGGFGGAGLGNSKQKYMYIPEPANDFIFSVVCEELGFIGAALIVVFFGLLVWRGVVIAMRARETFGGMLALGITVQVGLQAMLNIMVVTGTVPNTGISLPFFSSGGTSLMMLLMEMGVVLSVSRGSSHEKR